MTDHSRLILTDCDGVLLNWVYSFQNWMKHHGYEVINDNTEYNIGLRYGIEKENIAPLVRMFNESAEIAFMPPLLDAVYYVDLLHRKHGYVFHAITSLSNDANAQKLRIMNLENLFGKTVFEKYIFCDCGADKDEALAPYAGSGLAWVEDSRKNAKLGFDLGLDAMMIEHDHNSDYNNNPRNPYIPLHRNWKSIYNYLTGE